MMTMESQVADPAVQPHNLPTRESSRKRVKKTMGPDFIEDYTKSFKPMPLKGAQAIAAAAPAKMARKLNTIMDSARKDALLPPKLIIGEASLPRPDSCRECLKKGSMVLSFQQQESMLRCTGFGCQYAVHKKCSPYIPVPLGNEQVPFRCMECRRCVICRKTRITSDVDLMCSKCNDVYHMDCYVTRGNSFPENKAKPGAGSWVCGCCQGIESKPIRKRRRQEAGPQPTIVPTISSTIAPTILPTILPLNGVVPLSGLVTLNGVAATVAGNGSVLIEIPKNADRDAVKHPLVTDTRRTLRSPRTKTAPTVDLLQTSLSEPICDLLISPLPDGPYPESVSLKLAAVARAGLAHGSEPLILTKKEERKVRTKLEEDSELRQDMALWTVEQGAAYFRDSYPELSQLIMDNDMMGSALVIISRSQFLDLFKLPVGKALNMHAAVCRCRRMFF